MKRRVGNEAFHVRPKSLSTPYTLKLSKTSQGDPGALIANVNVILLFSSTLNQGCPVLLIEGHILAEFISNLSQHTCLEVSSNTDDLGWIPI